MSIKSPYPLARKMAQPKPILAIDPTTSFERIMTMLQELEALKEQHKSEHTQALVSIGKEHAKQIFTLERKIAEAHKELLRVQEIQRGEPGVKGDMPAIQDVVKALIPYIPAIPGPKGDMPIVNTEAIVQKVLKQIPSNKPKEIDHTKLADEVIKILIKDKKLKTEHITGLPNELASYRNQLAGKHYGSDTTVRGGGDTLKAGTNTTLTRNTDGTVSVNAQAGGGGSVSVYSETPVGLINGSNTTYTTLNNITTVIRLTLNGEDIDPAQYTTSGSGFTMLTPIPASFSGTPFTIVYSSGTSSSTSFYTDALTGTMNGSNTAFTVANTITTPLILFIAGVPYKPTTDFTTATTNVTMVVAPDATLNGQPSFLLHT